MEFEYDSNGNILIKKDEDFYMIQIDKNDDVYFEKIYNKIYNENFIKVNKIDSNIFYLFESILFVYKCQLRLPTTSPPNTIPSPSSHGTHTNRTHHLIFIPSNITTPVVKNSPKDPPITSWFFAMKLHG